MCATMTMTKEQNFLAVRDEDSFVQVTLDFEPIATHAGDVFLDEFLTLLICFRCFKFQEAIVPGRLCLRTSTTSV